ncbi:MAG: DUF169 domain-containing protein, partial [Pseudomonadota bacterium]
MTVKEAAEYLYDGLRLRTPPIGVKFLPDGSGFPEKTRRPLETLGKRITICQAVTLARVYGWNVGLTKKDLVCVPAMISFGFTRAGDQPATLGKLFCNVSFGSTVESARSEAASMSLLENGSYSGIVLAPAAKDLFEPDTVAVYGNPAQIMRLIQGWTYL